MLIGFLICIPPEGIGNEKGAISPFKLSPSALLAISLIFSSHAMETLEAFNHLKIDAIPVYNTCKFSDGIHAATVSSCKLSVGPLPMNGPWICYMIHVWKANIAIQSACL